MIKGFADDETYQIFLGRRARRLPADPGFVRTARRKLAMLDQAQQLIDLKSPPSNRLHPLEHDRAGQHAIAVNMQYRVCFTWRDGDAYDVEICDYH